jgi:hypothetical protein
MATVTCGPNGSDPRKCLAGLENKETVTEVESESAGFRVFGLMSHCTIPAMTVSGYVSLGRLPALCPCFPFCISDIA